jgi:hypothetical protein
VDGAGHAARHFWRETQTSDLSHSYDLAKDNILEHRPE